MWQESKYILLSKLFVNWLKYMQQFVCDTFVIASNRVCPLIIEELPLKIIVNWIKVIGTGETHLKTMPWVEVTFFYMFLGVVYIILLYKDALDKLIQ